MARKVKEQKQDPELDLLPIMNLFSILIPFLLSVAVFQKMAVIDINMPPTTTASTKDPITLTDELNLTVSITSTGLVIGSKNGFFPKIFTKELRDYQCKGEALWKNVDPSNSEGNDVLCGSGLKVGDQDIQKIHLLVIRKSIEKDEGEMIQSVLNQNDSVYLNPNRSIMKGAGFDYGIFLESKEELAESGKVVSTLAMNSAKKVNLKIMIEAKQGYLSAYSVLARVLSEINEKFAELDDADKVILVADDDIAYDKVIAVMDVAREAGFAKVQLAKMGR
jgi:biopolymer transport protein ExbD